MASITIRNLEPEIKEALRKRAASNGRSMEEEARHYFAQMAAGPVLLSPASAPAPISVSDPSSQTLAGKRICLIIGGGIAAYKCLDLIRRLRERGASVRPVMTKAATEFVTELSIGAIANDTVFTELFDRNAEHDVGHIRLSREADLIVVAPATADLMGKMSNGLANDLASTVLMATDKPVLIAPAMNPKMWEHPATKRNRKTLQNDGIHFIGPRAGEMAESGEAGFGRMAEPLEIVGAIEQLLDTRPKPLAGKKIIMTSGPTHEPIDPVRYIANRSSGKQGYAIATALADLGADVYLVSGPTSLSKPQNVKTIDVETAREMYDAVHQLLPADAAIFVAAVADYRAAAEADEKIKKEKGGINAIALTENPDILASIGNHEAKRPQLVIGFAAETQNLIKHGASKLKRKGADYIVANDVSPDTGIGGKTGVMGGDRNRVTLISKKKNDAWPEMTKQQVAHELAQLVAQHLVTVKV
ncbi:bifunctional phosphopantothenoylcysteine decarboxylase/phosphopantothenate--cysteine ligase CoaBC [Ahrensia sp. 13_GOM-1096m]|uniref:bifunctional phosphopantothenoylcysteine decarboxylase/phosphopantothenate--cysteine ligase CoaBC n=1 Tax=Ahrensia sp. 13_GOM-1096m TaxID=1380380 RepID=UPI00047EB7FD|nr:bifunctional phosphopantothenoylcysteine decarboxylase/phosphopantothenate--cysteine ligase CoaBC [Ahrensia sp. 13_GOM-1096m]